MKVQCKYCKEFKDINDFEIANVIKGISYRRLRCHSCIYSIKKNRRKKIALFISEYKNKLSCQRCGYSDYRAIIFHHTDRDTKDACVSDAIKRGWSINRIKNEIDKCIPLCANCHHIIHYQNERE